MQREKEEKKNPPHIIIIMIKMNEHKMSVLIAFCIEAKDTHTLHAHISYSFERKIIIFFSLWVNLELLYKKDEWRERGRERRGGRERRRETLFLNGIYFVAQTWLSGTIEFMQLLHQPLNVPAACTQAFALCISSVHGNGAVHPPSRTVCTRAKFAEYVLWQIN